MHRTANEILKMTLIVGNQDISKGEIHPKESAFLVDIMSNRIPHQFWRIVHLFPPFSVGDISKLIPNHIGFEVVSPIFDILRQHFIEIFKNLTVTDK